MTSYSQIQAGTADSDPSTMRIAFIALLAGAVCIAFAPIFVRLSELGPVTTAFYRLFFALPALWLWVWWQPAPTGTLRKPASMRDYALLALAGLFFAADLAVWHWSITLTSVANATLFANFAPIFVTLGSFLLFGERFRPLFLFSIALGIAGAAVMMADNLTLGTRYLAGDGLGILTAVFYGGYILTISRLRQHFSTATIMAWSGVVTTICLLPIAWFSEGNLVAPSWLGWLVLAGLALFSHAGGQSLIDLQVV